MNGVSRQKFSFGAKGRLGTENPIEIFRQRAVFYTQHTVALVMMDMRILPVKAIYATKRDVTQRLRTAST
ncbi:MAG: hypothetical protein J3T61_12975 [Candidatus Brocadiales bacterium]|nr:hypothetical protein [Candidatus Bathyanammoxibius sp.]